MKNLKEILRWLDLTEHANRGIGRTTALRKAAKEINGRLVVVQETEKDDVVLGSNEIIGDLAPLILDNYVVSRIIHDCLYVFEQQELTIDAKSVMLASLKKTIHEIERKNHLQLEQLSQKISSLSIENLRQQESLEASKEMIAVLQETQIRFMTELTKEGYDIEMVGAKLVRIIKK